MCAGAQHRLASTNVLRGFSVCPRGKSTGPAAAQSVMTTRLRLHSGDARRRRRARRVHVRSGRILAMGSARRMRVSWPVADRYREWVQRRLADGSDVLARTWRTRIRRAPVLGHTIRTDPGCHQREGRHRRLRTGLLRLAHLCANPRIDLTLQSICPACMLGKLKGATEWTDWPP